MLELIIHLNILFCLLPTTYCLPYSDFNIKHFTCYSCDPRGFIDRQKYIFNINYQPFWPMQYWLAALVGSIGNAYYLISIFKVYFYDLQGVWKPWLLAATQCSWSHCEEEDINSYYLNISFQWKIWQCA